jgi:hypothetical protein
MAHCAEIVDGIVTRVIVVSNDYEPHIEQWATEWAGGGVWKQTSYNANIRYNYAGVGYTYDEIDDAFVPPRPECGHEELLLNSSKQWTCQACDLLNETLRNEAKT